MIKRTCIVFLLGFLFHWIVAQDQAFLDSLFELISTDIPDKEKTDIYLQISEQYMYSDSVNTTRYANRAIQLAKEIGYSEAIVKANYSIAYVNFRKGYYPESNALFRQVSEVSDSINYNEGRTLGLIGLGSIAKKEGKYSQALEYYFTATKYAEAEEMKDLMARIFNNISVIYSDQEQYKKALEYLLKTLEIDKVNNDQVGIAFSTLNIGAIYTQMKRNEDALAYFSESLKIATKLQHQFLILANREALSIANLDLGRYDEALKYANKIRESNENLSGRHLIQSLIFYGSINYAKGNKSSARDFFEKALKAAKKAGDIKYIKTCSERLADIENETGNYKSAYDYHVLHKEVSDSIRNEEQTEKITRLQAEYDFQQERDSLNLVRINDAHNYEIELTKTKERELLFSILSFTFLLVIFIIFFLWNRLRNLNNKLAIFNSQLTEQKEQLEKADQLKSKIFSVISHDIRSPINSLFSLVYVFKDHLSQTGDDSLDPLLSKFEYSSQNLAQLLDNVLSWGLMETKGLTTKKKPLKVKELILETVHLMRPYTEAKSIKIIVEDNPKELYILADKKSMDMVIRNILSNAIKYVEKEKGTIKISTKEKSNKVEIAVTDNGVGMDKEKLQNLFSLTPDKSALGTEGEHGSGVGLKLVQDFMLMNNGKINVDSLPERGTTFTLVLPKP